MFAEMRGGFFDDAGREIDEIDEPIPETSRSPSFIRVRSAEGTPDESGEVVTIATVRHDTIVAPPSDLPTAPRWDDLDVDLKVQMLRLEEGNPHAAPRVLGEIGALADSLRAIAKRHDGAEALCRHTYEWASNVASRLASPGDVPEGELDAAEYSSLFVCKILEPMIDAGLEVSSRRGDEAARAALGELRERVFWLNWAARAAQAA